LVVGSSDRCVR